MLDYHFNAFAGAQKLGGQLAQQIKTLLNEIIVYNKQQQETGSAGSSQPTLTKGSILNRYETDLPVLYYFANLSTVKRLSKLNLNVEFINIATF